MRFYRIQFDLYLTLISQHTYSDCLHFLTTFQSESLDYVKPKTSNLQNWYAITELNRTFMFNHTNLIILQSMRDYEIIISLFLSLRRNMGSTKKSQKVSKFHLPYAEYCNRNQELSGLLWLQDVHSGWQ